jgi:hypothetical protein
MVRIQAWLGVQEITALEGKDVILFTSRDGTKYVLKNSIGNSKNSLIGRVEDTIILEGILIPGETFGGYPVLTEMAASMADPQADLSNYQITSNQPSVYDQTLEAKAPEKTLTGRVTIEHIELAYNAVSLDHCLPAGLQDELQAPYLYVQPMWVFTGHFDDGRRFEIRVQALPDEYLTNSMSDG